MYEIKQRAQIKKFKKKNQNNLDVLDMEEQLSVLRDKNKEFYNVRKQKAAVKLRKLKELIKQEKDNRKSAAELLLQEFQ